MTSERLVEMLSARLTPVRVRRLSHDALLLAAIGAVELLLLLLLVGARPDLATAITRPFFWWKLAAMGVPTAIALTATLRSFDPTRSPRPGLRGAAIAVAVALALGWLLDATHRSGTTIAGRMQWHEGMRCMAWMAMLALPMIAALGALMRRSAPTDPAGTARAAGTAGAAWGAFVFAFACPHDDPLYVAIWYLAGCSLVAVAARWLLAPVARW